MEAPDLWFSIPSSCTGSGLSFTITTWPHFTSVVMVMITIFGWPMPSAIITIFKWPVPSASSISRWFACWNFLLTKPKLNVPIIFGTKVVVLLCWFLFVVTPVAEPAKKASYSWYNNDHSKDNKNCPKWPIWMVWRWFPSDSIGVNQNWLLLWLRELLLLGLLLLGLLQRHL